ncbi:TetR/AcrR family transcriptional regulator [Streptomyces sp. NPDC047024]|uniref:TetR/AcrR family transcriptional regulator n=1 Tax=Streptomyces sp. NPDC047024 TaxID=3155476 RepID=UPI0033C03EBB
MTDIITRRTGGRSARVRRAVLDAASELLIESGLAATTIPAIAERSGVHHTSIYRRWDSRGSLLREVLLEAVDLAVPVPDTGDLRSDLIDLFEEVRDLLESPMGKVLFDVMRSTDDSLADLRGSYWRARLEQCAIVIERAREDHGIPEDVDSRVIFEMIVGPLHARALMSNEPLGTVDAHLVVDTVLNGMLVGRPGPPRAHRPV